MGRSTLPSDTNIRIPEEAKGRLAAIAAAEGLSLRAYLARLAETLLTPAERAERARKANRHCGNGTATPRQPPSNGTWILNWTGVWYR